MDAGADGGSDRDPVYVSITGLRLRRWWHIFKFYKYAASSFKEAREAPGVLFAEVKTVGKLHCTLTAWRDQDAMREYLYTGRHLDALSIFDEIATGETYGYTTKDIPDWDTAIELLTTKGKSVGMAARG